MFTLPYPNLAKLRRLSEGMRSGAHPNVIFMKITIQTVDCQLQIDRQHAKRKATHMHGVKVYGREEAQLHAFFTSAQDVGEW